VIAVVHLVWGPLGPGPLRAFLDSYRLHPAGAEHELVVLYNGVEPDMRPGLDAELEGYEHRVVLLEDPVQDLAAYAQAAKRLEHDRLCFLNSHSQILETDWLAKLADGLNQPGVGLVGASGSGASLRSWVTYALHLPSPYRGLLPDKRTALQQFQAIETDLGKGLEPKQSTGSTRTLLRRIRAGVPGVCEQLVRFEGFPARHLRTNAFMVERVPLSEVRMGKIASKMDAYALESGRRSITNQFRSRGLRTLIVARDGGLFDPERWAQSRTFWQGDQEALMVADNQTRVYASGPIDRRRLLSAYAWGREADPEDPAATAG
jgi:hypothetical protein